MNRKKALEDLLDILGDDVDEEDEPELPIEDDDDWITNLHTPPKHLKELGRPDLSRLRKAVWPWE